jgi:hypothetical protein
VFVGRTLSTSFEDGFGTLAFARGIRRSSKLVVRVGQELVRFGEIGLRRCRALQMRYGRCRIILQREDSAEQ